MKKILTLLATTALLTGCGANQLTKIKILTIKNPHSAGFLLSF